MNEAISATSGTRHAVVNGIARLSEKKPSLAQSTVNNMDETEMMKAAIPVLECCFTAPCLPSHFPMLLCKPDLKLEQLLEIRCT